MVGVSAKWISLSVWLSVNLELGSSPKANPLTEKRAVETILAKFTIFYTRSDTDLRQAKALPVCVKPNARK
jgi:hypothetical protein